VVVTVVALVRLNKHLMGAFARPDRGDLAGIHHISAASQPPTPEAAPEKVAPEVHEGAAP
jgi:hypothetical protein